ncbi:unnamed protein product, partial [Notodromas monacha]
MTNQTTHDMENGIDFDMVTKMKHQVSEYALPTLTKPRIALLFSMPEKDKLMAIMSDEALNTLMTASQEIARTARGKVTLNAVMALNDLEQILPPPVDELSSKSRFMEKRALTSLLAGVAIDLPNPGDWRILDGMHVKLAHFLVLREKCPADNGIGNGSNLEIRRTGSDRSTEQGRIASALLCFRRFHSSVPADLHSLTGNLTCFDSHREGAA